MFFALIYMIENLNIATGMKNKTRPIGSLLQAIIPQLSSLPLLNPDCHEIEAIFIIIDEVQLHV
jgi:hypothetical protein